MHEFYARLKLRPLIATEVILASFVINILALASSFYVILVLNRYVAHGVEATLATLTAGVVLAIVLEFLLRHTRLQLARGLTLQPDEKLARSVFSAVTELKQNAVDKLGSGVLVDAVSGVDTIRGTYSATNLTSVLDAPFALVFLFALFLLSPTLALIATVLVAMTVGLAFMSASSLKSRAQNLKRDNASGGSAVMTAVQASETLRAFNGRELVLKLWREHIWRLLESDGALTMQRGSRQGIIQSIGAMLSVLIISVGAILVVDQELDVGALIGCNILAARAFANVTRAIGLIESVTKAQTAFAETTALDRLPKEPVKGVTIKNMQGRLSFNDVTFAYPGDVTPLFENLDLELLPGRVLAVTGANATGKTTLCRLMLGLAEPIRGQILIDGVELRQMDLSWWRSQVLYLPQEPTFMNGTLIQNLRMNAPNATDEQLSEAITLAGVKDFIDRHKDGLAMTIANQGRNLSLGIRRRLALARALLSDGKVVIFDEPTEGMDALGASATYSVLNKLFVSGKTIIVCANDPNVLRAAHIVLSLDSKPVPEIKEMTHRQSEPVSHSINSANPSKSPSNETS